MQTRDDTAHSIAAYMRIASLAIAGYDFFLTSPTALRIYQTQWRAKRLSVEAVMFLLLRASSILILIISNVGFFSRFSDKACQHFYIFAPIFKVTQGAVSQAVLGMRAWKLSQKDRVIGAAIGSIYITAVILESVTTLYGRTGKSDPVYHNCLPFSSESTFLSAYSYYAVVIVYDVFTTIVSIYFLMKYKIMSHSSMMRSFISMMLVDGVGYFIALSALNTVNLIFYRVNTNAELQTSAASLCYCFLWIITQKLLIHLHEAHRRFRGDDAEVDVLTVTQTIDSARDVSRAIRSQFETKTGVRFDMTGTHHAETDEDVELQQPEHVVQVRIEKTFKLERNRGAYQMEDYSQHQIGPISATGGRSSRDGWETYSSAQAQSVPTRRSMIQSFQGGTVSRSRG